MGFLDKLKQLVTGKNKKDNDQYLSGFDKTKESFGKRLGGFRLGFKSINEDFLEELMIVLLESDIGITTANEIISLLQKKSKNYVVLNFDEVMDLLVESMAEIYGEEAIEINLSVSPTVIMVVGVNGSGKTTSCAKLAYKYLQMGKTVALVAGDTFRAGAIEQLSMWASRLDVPIIKGKEGQDPSSVLVDGCRYAKTNNIDILICDTAGRLQNKANLMNELSKMKRVLGREIEGAPHYTWLVLDSTTGQNGLSQASIFNEITSLDGIILTKMDGTSKGGIVIAIKNILKIPVLFLGLGEGLEDLKEFDLNMYLYSITQGIKDVKEDGIL